MSHSLTGQSTGRIFSGLVKQRRPAYVATILSFALVGLTSGARAAPPASCSDSPFHLTGFALHTRNCVHPFVAVEVGGSRSKTNFDVVPPFDVNGSGFIFALNGGVLFDIPGTPISIGPRFGWQGGNTTGNIANPEASPFFLYTVKRSWTLYQEALIQVPINLGNSPQQPNMLPFVTASAGIAEVKLQFNGTSGAFQVTDSPTSIGFTGTIGVGIPINQTLFDGTFAFVTEARLIKTDSFDVTLPGKFKSKYQETSVTLGFRYQW